MVRTVVVCALAGAFVLAWAMECAGAGGDGTTGQSNLFTNGDMEIDADADAVPDHWECETGVRLGTGQGRGAGKALTIRGPEMPLKRYALFASPVKAFELKKGRAYRFSWWWKCEDLPGRSATIGVATPASGISRYVEIPRDWGQQVYTFVAEKDFPRDSAHAFHVALSFPGTVCIDDVCLEEIPVDEVRPPGEDFVLRPAWPEKKGGNLVPNASFELGGSGWGSWAPRRDGDWGHIRPCRLMSEIVDVVSRHGRRSLRIDLDGDNLPTPLHAARGGGGLPNTTLFAGTYGAIPVEKGKQYVLSVWLKADAPDTVAVLSIFYFPSGRHTLPETRFAVSTEWRRCALAFTAEEDFAIPLAGLAWRPTGRQRATLWMDAVQLEVAEEPAAFRTREPLEAAIGTDRIGNIFEKGESLQVSVSVFNDGPAKASFAGKLVVSDYWDREAAAFPVSVSLDPGKGKIVSVDTGIKRAGFYRARLLSDGQSPLPLMQNLRTAIIKPYRREDHPGFPRVGINNPPPWLALRDLIGKAGMGIVRYWEFWWDFIEPAQGRPDYRLQERDIASLKRDGFEVQVMTPYPSGGWLARVPYDFRLCYRPAHWSVYWHSKPNRRWDRPRYNFPLRPSERAGGGRAVELVATETSSRDAAEGLPRLHQRDTLRLGKGKRYRVSFYASRRGSGKGKAHVALLTYPERADAGLDESFELQSELGHVPRWQWCEFDFTCTADTLLGSSLQFYLEEPGVLAVDDVSLRELVAGKVGSELVLNGDFEDVFIDTVKHSMVANRSTGSRGRYPRDLVPVRALYARTVAHFKEQIKHWEILNEPTYMSMADYVRYLREAYAGIKDADPDAVVVGGIDALSISRVSGIGHLWNLGAREHLDVVTSHSYETTLAPEAFEKHLEDLNAYLDSHGGRKPIRMTEGNYFADDDLVKPRWKHRTHFALLSDERERGDYLVRYETILFGNGVDCIMYHPGGSPSLTYAALGPWCLEYGCVPRKVYAVRAAFSHIVTPGAKIEKKRHFFEDSIYAYVFSRARDAVAVVWSPKRMYRIDKAAFRNVDVLDIFGEPVVEEDILIGASAIYLVGDSTDAVLKAADTLEQAREESP